MEVATEPTVRLPWALAIGVAAVVLAVLVVAAAVRIAEPALPSGRAVAPTQQPAAPPASTVAYDRATSVARVQELHAALPSRALACQPGADPVPSLFASWVPCEVAVHRRYDKAGHSWEALVALGVLPPDLARSDLAQTSDALLDRVVATSYARQQVRRTAVRTGPAGVAVPGRGQRTTLRVQFSIPGLPTKADDVTLVVAQLSTGEYAAWVALVPEDSPAELKQAVNESAASISAR